MLARTATQGRTEDVIEVEVRGTVAFAVPVSALPEALPMYLIRGAQVFRSEWHPDGPSRLPVFEIRGDQMFATVWA